MLACTALVGCTNDDIENVDNLDVQKGDAYISLSIDSSTNSSRAETGGDTDPNADDNGHHNSGTIAENEVNKILLILTSNADGKVDIFTKADGSDNLTNENSGLSFEKINGGGYELSEPYHLKNQGTYQALIVINPTSSLITAIEEQSHEEAYETILNYQYTYTGVVAEGGNDNIMKDFTTNGFMMANKEECTIEVNPENNSTSNPAVGEIEVERVISKITFRPKNNNVYPVNVNLTTYSPVTDQGWYIKEYKTVTEGETTKQIPVWAFATLNKITETNSDGQNYWIQVSEGAITNENVLDPNKILGVYIKSNETHDGFEAEGNPITDTDVFTVIQENEYPSTFTLARADESVTSTSQYYVKLEGYALTNLSKTVYGVRHIAQDNYVGPKEMGKLDGTYIYLVDPNSTNKNDVTFTAAGEFEGAPAIKTWFNNTLSAVATEGNGLINTSDFDETFWNNTTYFKALPASITDGNQDYSSQHGNITQIGQHLSYCFENAVIASKQLPGLVTGIVFVGQIYTDEACNQKVPVMYKYKKVFYRDLRELLENNSDDTALNGITENSTAQEVITKNIKDMEVYNNGRCFYFCSEIKHFDDGKSDFLQDEKGDYVTDAYGNKTFQGGVMEFAIMRNNIYSLEINNITSIGSSVINPLPGYAFDDSGAYLKMRCSILPWIVRFNNINF